MPTKNQTPAAPALSPARQSLKDARESLERVRAIEEKARGVKNAAAAAVEDARNSLAQYAGVDEDLVQSRLAVLKGETSAKSADDLREAQRLRFLAHEELNTSSQTLQLAEKEHEALLGNVERERKEVESRATQVLLERVAEVIALFEEANIRRETLRMTLRGLLLTPGWEALSEPQRSSIIENAASRLGLPYGYPADWQNIQRTVGAALSNHFNPEPSVGIPRAMAFWKRFADAVLADPAAEPAPLPSAEELWG
jgi:hypothetical protein